MQVTLNGIDYVGVPDYLTIKLHINGHFGKPTKIYEDEQVRYVDTRDVDQLCIMKIFSMLNEAGEPSIGDFFYKKPCCDMNSDLFPLLSASDVVAMCSQVNTSRAMHVYCGSKPKKS